ncbi:hypothetical protein L9F63_017502, partial [Diploptera punctata]
NGHECFEQLYREYSSSAKNETFANFHLTLRRSEFHSRCSRRFYISTLNLGVWHVFLLY